MTALDAFLAQAASDCVNARPTKPERCSAPGLCDDGEEPYLQAEVSIFHGRNDEWFVLEWWGDGMGFVVSRAMPTLYSCDSGPMPAEIALAEGRHPDACEHGVRLKNHCATCAAMVARS